MENYDEITLEDIRIMMMEIYCEKWKIPNVKEYQNPLRVVNYEECGKKYVYLGLDGTPDKICSIYNPKTQKIAVFAELGTPIDTPYDNNKITITDLENYNDGDLVMHSAKFEYD